MGRVFCKNFNAEKFEKLCARFRRGGDRNDDAVLVGNLRLDVGVIK